MWAHGWRLALAGYSEHPSVFLGVERLKKRQRAFALALSDDDDDADLVLLLAALSGLS